MAAHLTSSQVWQEVAKHSFAVLGYVTPRGEARSVGIVYAVRAHEVYIATARKAWKARHIAANPHVSLTVTIPKRIPFLPWVAIPAATISFSGEASLEELQDTTADIQRTLLRDLRLDSEAVKEICFIHVRPTGEFVTYGVGVSLPTMRYPDAACGRAPV